MRYAFGFVGLLVAVALMMYLFASQAKPVAKVGVDARQQAEQISGRDETGQAATDAIELAVERRNGRAIGMRITSIAMGSTLQKMYGLQLDDVIVQAGDMPFVDPLVTDPQLASGLVLEAYRGSRPIVVQRKSGPPITLKAAAPTPPAATPPGGATNASGPAPAPQPERSNGPLGGLQKQLDQIRNRPQE